jgi:hypothetical protein
VCHPGNAGYLILASLRSFIAVALLFALLKLLHLRSDFGAVAVCYTIAVVYTPVFSVLAMPSASNIIAILSQIKLEHLGTPYELVNYLIQHSKEFDKSSPQHGPLIILSELAGVVVLISNMLVAECLAQSLSNDRFKTYAAVWVASAASLVPSAILGLFQLYSLWHFIK